MKIEDEILEKKNKPKSGILFRRNILSVTFDLNEQRK